MDSGLLTWQEM